MTEHVRKYYNRICKVLFNLCLLLIIISSKAYAQSPVIDLKNHLKTTSNDSLRITLYDRLSKEYLYQDRDSARMYIDSLWLLSKKLDTQYAQALAYKRQGTFEIADGHFSAAMVALSKAEYLYTRLHDTIALAQVYKNIGTNDYYMQDYKNSLANYKKGIKITDPDKLPTLYASFLNNQSEVFRTKKNLDSAVTYARDAMSFSKSKNEAAPLAISYFQLGAAYLDQERFYYALDYLSKALNSRRLPDQYPILASIFKARALIALNKTEDAKMLLDDTENYVGNSNNWIISLYYNTARKDYFKKLENFQQALNYSERIDRLIDQVNTSNRLRLSKNLHTEFDLRRQNTENQSLRHDAELSSLKLVNQRNIIWAVGVFIFVLMILLLIMNRLYEINQRTNEKLRSRHEILDKNNRNLEKINIQKNNLFSIVAHDVKSPLSAIMTSIHMLNDNIEDFSAAELKTLTQELSTQTESLYNLLEGVLTWTKSQMDGYKFTRKNINLSHLMQDLVKIEQLTIKKKKLNIICEIAQEEVYTDLQAITVILRNLITNAIKFTPHGGTIKLLVSRNGKETSIAVEDTGLGISQDKIEQIFVKRQRYTRKGTADEKGNGIGLILCSEIANAMGGAIEVKSTVGRGSSFALIIVDDNA